MAADRDTFIYVAKLAEQAERYDETRPFKRSKKTRVAFRDQVGEELVHVVGVSDGADVETEPGPMGVKESSSLVGKYESLVQTTLIPKGKEISSSVKEVTGGGGVTDKLQQVLNKVKAPPPPSKGGIYDDLYGGVGLGSSSWAYSGGPAAESKVSSAVTRVMMIVTMICLASSSTCRWMILSFKSSTLV